MSKARTLVAPPPKVINDTNLSRAWARLLPFAGSGRQMANRDLEPRFAGEFLQFNPPEPYPSPVGATTVDRDQQA